MTVFIYGLVCPLSNQIRYIGKSTSPEKRLCAHISGAKRFDYNHHTARWIRKVLKNGLRPTLQILHEVKSGEVWQDIERKLIKEALEKGFKLTNSTAGGEGLDYLNEEESAAYRMKLSASLKKVWNTPEAKAAQSARSRATWSNPELKEKILKGIRGSNQTLEFRGRMSAINTEINSRPEVKAVKSKKSKDRWANNRERMMEDLTKPEVKKVQSEKRKAAWASPEYRNRLQEIHASPESKKRRSNAAKKRSTPEYRAMMAERTRISWEKRRLKAACIETEVGA